MHFLGGKVYGKDDGSEPCPHLRFEDGEASLFTHRATRRERQRQK